jgi:hypothetical protein
MQTRPAGFHDNACDVLLKGSFGPRYLNLEAIAALASKTGKGVEGDPGTNGSGMADLVRGFVRGY